MIEKLANFRFRFDVSVFGDSQVSTDSGWIQVFQFEARVQERFMGAKNPYASGPSAYADLLSLLVLGFLEFTNSRW